MGDLSTEPSMEDILSSIKRIISEEGDTPAKPLRARKGNARAAPSDSIDDTQDEVLELSDPMPDAPPSDPIVRTTAIPPVDTPARPEAIVSSQTAEATRGALDALSKLLVKPDASSDGTLEGLVREMLRPMLREWIDANLPPMVESIVSREITRITREGR